MYRGTEEFDVTTKPPHEFPEEPLLRYLPRGKGQEVLRTIMDDSRELFATSTDGRSTRARRRPSMSAARADSVT